MSRPVSRAASASSTLDTSGGLQVNLKDCEHLIRSRVIGLPGVNLEVFNSLLNIFSSIYRSLLIIVMHVFKLLEVGGIILLTSLMKKS